MIATDSGLADFFTVIAVVLLAGCVACCALALAQKQIVDPLRAGNQFPYPSWAALLGWAGVGFGWLGTLVT